MKKSCENRYKTSRETAGLTQSHAAELLHVSERSLSDYENDRTKVPDDVASIMADVYRSPHLALWHLKETSPLGKFIPEMAMPQTNGDMAFQLILADDQLSPAVETIKKIMSNGQPDADEWIAFHQCIDIIQSVSGKLLSAIVYARLTYREVSSLCA
jgi:DNA-binding XRE family transcriptional regulator